MDASERIKKRCKEIGVTVREVEIELDFSNGYINKLRAETVPHDKIKKIADRLDTSVDYLLYGEDGTEILVEPIDRLSAERRLINRLADLSDAQVKLMLDMVSQMTGKDYGDR
jgi:transcriptional regulator with XRE-family HTH domain